MHSHDVVYTLKVKKLAPQVVHASKMLFENPDDEV